MSSRSRRKLGCSRYSPCPFRSISHAFCKLFRTATRSHPKRHHRRQPGESVFDISRKLQHFHHKTPVGRSAFFLQSVWCGCVALWREIRGGIAGWPPSSSCRKKTVETCKEEAARGRQSPNKIGRKTKRENVSSHIHMYTRIQLTVWIKKAHKKPINVKAKTKEGRKR